MHLLVRPELSSEGRRPSMLVKHVTSPASVLEQKNTIRNALQKHSINIIKKESTFTPNHHAHEFKTVPLNDASERESS
jgi:hypothetical protein